MSILFKKHNVRLLRAFPGLQAGMITSWSFWTLAFGPIYWRLLVILQVVQHSGCWRPFWHLVMMFKSCTLRFCCFQNQGIFGVIDNVLSGLCDIFLRIGIFL